MKLSEYITWKIKLTKDAARHDRYNKKGYEGEIRAYEDVLAVIKQDSRTERQCLGYIDPSDMEYIMEEEKKKQEE